MKKYISLMILFLCSYILQAQERIITIRKDKPIKELKKGGYYKNPEMEKLGKPFEGTWVFKNEKETLTIKIELKKTYVPKIDFYIDKLQLDYFYETGDNNIITNSAMEGYRKAGTPTSERTASFISSDMIKEKGIEIELELLENNHLKMILNNRLGGITLVLPDKPKQKRDLTFSIPTDIILTKQNF